MIYRHLIFILYLGGLMMKRSRKLKKIVPLIGVGIAAMTLAGCHSIGSSSSGGGLHAVYSSFTGLFSQDVSDGGSAVITGEVNNDSGGYDQSLPTQKDATVEKIQSITLLGPKLGFTITPVTKGITNECPLKQVLKDNYEYAGALPAGGCNYGFKVTSNHNKVAEYQGSVTVKTTGTSDPVTAATYDGQPDAKASVNFMSIPTTVSAGYFSACEEKGSTGKVYCWGNNNDGQLGNGQSGTEKYSDIAVRVHSETLPSGRLLLMQTAAEAASHASNYVDGGASVCSLASDGQAYCWGYNNDGQLGDGNKIESPIPVKVSLPTGQGVTSWQHIVADGSLYVACGLASNDQIYCWGDNKSGLLGIGKTHSELSSVDQPQKPITLPNSNVKGWSQVTVGDLTSCALTTGASPQAYCWGNADDGVLGNGSTVNTTQPTKKVSLPHHVQYWTQLGAGLNYACAIGNNTQAYCWGTNSGGQLGANLSPTNRHTATELIPVEVKLPTVAGITGWKELAVGPYTSCAITNNDQLYCWGSNNNDLLGDGFSKGQQANSIEPIPVHNPSGVKAWRQVTISTTFACGLANNSKTYCWGNDQYGQLGNGEASNTNFDVPTRVKNSGSFKS